MTYRSEVLADSPTAYYELAETSGNFAPTNGAITGTATNTITYNQEGIPGGGRAIKVDGTGGRIYLTSYADLFANNAWTIELWIKADTTYTGGGHFFRRDGNSKTILARGDGATPEHAVGFASSGLIISSTLSLQDGFWHQIVMQKTSSTTFKMWVDGVEQTSQSGTYVSGGLGTSTPLVFGGKDASTAEAFDGYIAQIAIWDTTALSSTRIGVHYTAGISYTPMTASGSMPTPTVTTQKNVSYSAAPMTGSNTAPGGVIAPLYMKEVLKDSPVTYYKFDEPSGTVLSNQKGTHSFDLTTGSVTLNQNGPQGAYKSILNTTGSAAATLALGSNSFQSRLAAFSIELWFKSNESQGSISDGWQLIDFTPASGNPGLFQFVIPNDGVGITMNWFGGTGAQLTLHSNAAIDDQAWHHIVFTANTSTDFYRLYLDGTQVATDTTNFTTASGTGGTLTVARGGTTGVTNPFNGNITQLATYSTELSSTRVFAHYNAMNNAIISDAPMAADGLFVNPTITAQRAVNYSVTPMTASGLFVDPAVLAQRNISYTTTVVTASGLFVDPAVVIQSNVNYNATPMIADAILVFPALPSYQDFPVPMTASGLMRDPVVVPGHSITYNAQPMTAVALMRENEEADLPTNHPYYKAVRSQVDGDDIWVAFTDVSGTVVTEEVSTIFNLGTWARTNARYYGGMILGVNGPNDRLAANFDGIDDYMQIGELLDDVNTGTYSIEFVFRTSRQNQVIVAGQETSSEGFAPGSAVLRATSVNTRDGRISLMGYGPGVVSNNYQELLIGDKNVSDGEWHHVVISSWWYPVDRATDYTNSEIRGQMGIWVDGKLDKRYSSINVNFRMSRPDLVGRSNLGQANYFEGDMSMLVARRGYGIPKYLIEQNYYVALGVNAIAVTPATVISAMPSAKGRGNSVRVLNIYLRNVAAGALVDTSRVVYDTRNGRLNTSILAWSGPNNPGGYRDSVTDERRLVNFQTDINMDNFDIINVIDGSLLTDGPASTKIRTDEYLATALVTSKGRANKILDDFYTSLKRVVKDNSKAIFIRDPEVARRAGLIVNYTQTIPVREHSLAPTGKPFWGQLGAGLVDEYDYWAWANNPWSNFSESPLTGGASWNSDNEYQYEDTHYLSGERIVATESELTNRVGPTLAEVINKIYANPFTRTGQELAMRYDPNISGLQIGQEVLFQTRIYDKYSPGAKDNLPIFSVHPDNVLYGTVIATELAEDWVGRTRVSNPRSDYATTIIIKEGQLLEGEEMQGRIALSFNNDIAAPEFIRMGLVGENEPVAKKRFQMSTYRSAGSYIAVNVNGQVTGVTPQIPAGQTQAPPTTGDTGWYIFQPTEQASYEEINGDMGRRIFLWLSAGTDNPGDGDVINGVESLTGSVSMPQPSITGQRHVTVSSDAMRATGTMLDSADENVNTLATPMTAVASMNSTEKKIVAEPMIASAVMLDDFNGIFDRGVQVNMTFNRTQNKTIVLFLRSDR